MTLVFCVLFSVGYILLLWLFAKVAGPGGGNAELVMRDGKAVGAAHVGQLFTSDKYFWGRPSCAGDGYDATGSCGSNMGPTDSAYLGEVEARVEHFLRHHPYLTRGQVPAEMVTASGSGLDPDITPECAYVQVRRVASNRHIAEAAVRRLVDSSVERPLLGLFGPPKVNVLKLNLMLDKMASQEAAPFHIAAN